MDKKRKNYSSKSLNQELEKVNKIISELRKSNTETNEETTNPNNLFLIKPIMADSFPKDTEKNKENKDIKILSNKDDININNQEKNCLIQKPSFIRFEEIAEKYFNFFINFKSILIKGENSKLIEKNISTYLSKKRNRNKKETEIKNNLTKGKGRKKKGQCETGAHDRYSVDNIICKIKAYFFDSLRIFINSVLPEDQRLFKIDSQIFAKNISKKTNLELLSSKLSEIFSVDISKKYNKNKYKSNYNKEIISKILLESEKSKKVVNILNLSYGECLDIFRYKISPDIMEKIGEESLNHFRKIDTFLQSVYSSEIKRAIIESKSQNMEENVKYIKEHYMEISDLICSIILVVYNYEKWFFNKKEVKSKAFQKI